jgi:hypothetical protein
LGRSAGGKTIYLLEVGGAKRLLRLMIKHIDYRFGKFERPSEGVEET